MTKSTSKKSRKGPSESATLFKVGTKKKGNDGNMWIIVENIKGIKRWQKTNNKKESKKGSRRLSTKKTSRKQSDNKKMSVKSEPSSKSYIEKKDMNSEKKYTIIDNGGKPFKIKANNKSISVYTYDDNKLIKTFTKFNGYWKGYDPISKRHGNSILIKVSDTEYIYIGSEIYSFKTKDEIIDYLTPIGNRSNVPYPVAYGTDNVYFMLDKKFIKKDELETPAKVKNAEKIYGEFYGYIGSKKGKHNKQKMKSVKLLVKRRWI